MIKMIMKTRTSWKNNMKLIRIFRWKNQMSRNMKKIKNRISCLSHKAKNNSMLKIYKKILQMEIFNKMKMQQINSLNFIYNHLLKKAKYTFHQTNHIRMDHNNIDEKNLIDF